MGKAALGFIAGVALTGMVFLLFDEASEDIPAEPVLIEVPDSAARIPEPIAATGLQTVPSMGEANSESGVVSSASADDRLPNLEELKQRADATRRANDAAQRELLRAQRLARWADEPPPSLPIVLPAEFDYLLDDPSDNHERIQREAIDPVWAATTETQIHGYLATRPKATEEYGYPTVHCRTTRCEIAFVAYGVGEAREFRSAISGVLDEPWMDQFTSGGVSLINANIHNRGDVTTILWHLTRTSERFRATGQPDDPTR